MKYGDDEFNEFCRVNAIGNPSYDTGKRTETSILRTDFGDGYSQRGSAGINDLTDSWSLSWNELPIDKVDLLEKYFRSRRGYKSFLWYPIREEEGPGKRFICGKWGRGFVGTTHDSFAANFEEVFDII